MSKVRFELTKFTHTIVNNLLFRSAFPIAYNTQKLCENTHFSLQSRPLQLFHVGKTTVQACFVFGKERLELSILSALDFESSVYANSTTYRNHLLVDLNHCRWDENPLS